MEAKRIFVRIQMARQHLEAYRDRGIEVRSGRCSD